MVSSQAYSASNSFQAVVVAHNEASITESNSLHFGTIAVTPGAACNLDGTGTVSGQCATADANIAVGVISISGLMINQPYQIEVVGSDDGVLRFNPAMTVDSVSLIDDDSDQKVSTLIMQSTESTDILVYGNLEVLSLLQASQSYQASYTINVNFQ
ncbi:DUF4402 domain-containing protein [Alteromonas sp. D210916BOD_24]|uniref:DUF4402 domain-containing protein n=1 Tax=Alteromonas sp. D210916BOD_24 TaxID=3157618 RepID=UPI00399C9D61